MKNTVFRSIIILLATLPTVSVAQQPVAKQGTLIETISASEILVEATGIYRSPEKSKRNQQRDVDRVGVNRALEDAKRTAVYFVLYGGTDPIIRSQADRDRLEPRVLHFYDMVNINRYITYEDTKFIQQVKIEDGTGIRVVKRFRVNKEHILRDLESMNILAARTELAEALGRPQLMVIPETPVGKNPVEILRNDPIARHAATVVESHLTAKQYDVIVPQQMEQLASLNELQMVVGGRQDDIAYSLAVSIGSDVYITYGGTWEPGAHNTRRFAMTVRAYETTTGRLLGAETGYSVARQGESMISVEEAMNGAIDAVLSRVNAYWREDMSRGVQYKILISIDPSYSEDEVFEIQDVFMDAARSVSKSSRENIATRQTLDYLVWVDPARYNSSRTLFRALKQYFDASAYGAKLRTININRKMILLKID